jgi:hypothetical protein
MKRCTARGFGDGVITQASRCVMAIGLYFKASNQLSSALQAPKLRPIGALHVYRKLLQVNRKRKCFLALHRVCVWVIRQGLCYT